MRQDEFYQHTRDLFDRCLGIMTKADQEYASDHDKFANFRWQAEVEGRTSEQVAVTFMLKHIRSIAKGVSVREPMEDRICDAINYLFLIAGMRHEQAQGHTGPFAPTPTPLDEAVWRATPLDEAVWRAAEAARHIGGRQDG